MTLPVCDQVAERVALGEPLGELAGHVESCASCRGLVEVSSKLGGVRHAVDPGLGFTARMTVGAQHRLAVRRRRRVALGLAATVASGAIGVFVMTRSEERGALAIRIPDIKPQQPEPPGTLPDEDLEALVKLSDVDHASRVSARWSEIEEPLAPYRKLLKGVTP